MTEPPTPAPAVRVATPPRISRQAPSSEVAVNQHQARHLVQIIRLLEREALLAFRVPVAARLPTDRHVEFFRLEAYRIFVEGAYACGFVCGDLAPDNPLESHRGRETRAIEAWTFPELRQYVHHLVRHERWSDGYSSPILEALAQGHLQRVADRLERDDALYDPA